MLYIHYLIHLTKLPSEGGCNFQFTDENTEGERAEATEPGHMTCKQQNWAEISLPLAPQPMLFLFYSATYFSACFVFDSKFFMSRNQVQLFSATCSP